MRAAAIRRTLAASGNTFVGKRFGKHFARTKVCLMETFNDLRFTICLTMKVWWMMLEAMATFHHWLQGTATKFYQDPVLYLSAQQWMGSPSTPPSPGLLTDNTRDWYQVGAESLQIPPPPPHHWHTGHHGDVVLSPLLRRVSWSLVWGVWLCLGGDNDWDVLWCGGHQAAADQAACLHRLSAAPGELRAGLGRAALYTRPVTSILTHTI